MLSSVWYLCASSCYSGVVTFLSSLTIAPYNLLLWLVFHYPVPLVCSAVVDSFGWKKLWSWGCSLCFLQWIILSVQRAFFHTHKVCYKPLRSSVSSHLYPWWWLNSWNSLKYTTVVVLSFLLITFNCV